MLDKFCLAIEAVVAAAIAILLLIMLGQINECRAEGNRADSPYFITSQHFAKNCDSYIAQMSKSKGWKIAFLWNTPGHDYSCLFRVLRHPKLEAYEVILVNEVCETNKNCGGYELFRQLGGFRTISNGLAKGDRGIREGFRNYFRAARAALQSGLQGRKPKCYVSPVLESRLQGRAAQRMVNLTRRTFPACKIVWNPRYDNPTKRVSGMDVLEIHGSKSRPPRVPYIVNADGEDPLKISWAEYFRKYRTAELAFAWIQKDNCRREGPFIDPRLRTFCPVPRDHRIRAKILEGE